MSTDQDYLKIREDIIFPAINEYSIELSTKGISTTLIEDVSILQDKPDHTLGGGGVGLKAPRMQSSINVTFPNEVTNQYIFGVIGDDKVLFTEVGAINAKHISLNEISEEKVNDILKEMVR